MSLGISGAAWLAAGAVVGGAVISANAAGDAADQMAQGGRESNALQRGMYDQTRKDNAGIRARGDAAGNRLSYLMGLPGGTASGQSREQVKAGVRARWTAESGMANPNIDESGLNAQADYEMSQLASHPSTQASDPQAGSLSRNFGASDLASDPIYNQFAGGIQADKMRDNADMASRGAFSDSLNHRFGTADFQVDPGYAFRTSEGLKATANTSNARNGSYSGATLKALERFGQDNASQEYGRASDRFNTDRSYAAGQYDNAFSRMNTDRNFASGQGDAAYNRFGTNQTTQYNRLAGISGTGQTATNNVNAAGAAYAQGAGNTLQGIGNAQAAGTIGGANAWSGAAQQGVNNYQQNNMLDLLRNRQSSSLYAPQVNDGGYSAGQGSAYGGNRQGM